MPTDLRLQRHPIFDDEPQSACRVTITVDGRPMEALEGESLAAALWAGGHTALRHDENSNTLRGMYCGIGHCYECRVIVDGIPDVRSCLVEVRNGMQVSLRAVVRPDEDDGSI